MSGLAELGEIAKARHKDIPKKGDGEYRDSHLRAINPRSVTQVRRGSGINRAGRLLGGAAGGSGVGYLVGSAATGGRGAKLGASLGALAGSNVGHHFNRTSGDTRAYNRRSGKRNKGKWAIPYLGTYNTY